MATPLDADKLEELLMYTRYNRKDTAFLVNGFRKGFSLQYSGPVNRQSQARNLPFTIGDKFCLWNKLMKEVHMGRAAGPFTKVPFKNFIQSPIGLVPKDGGNSTRLIFHLLYNFTESEQSVNHHTPENLCLVQYKDIDYAVETCLELMDDWKIIRRGNGKLNREQEFLGTIFYGKSDLKSAFKILPLDKASWPWTVMMAYHPITGEKKFFLDKTLPFGHSISCSLFQKFSDALCHILEAHLQMPKTVTNYLDDFLVVSTNQHICNKMIREFLLICEMIKFLVSLDKTEWATSRIVFLGIVL